MAGHGDVFRSSYRRFSHFHPGYSSHSSSSNASASSYHNLIPPTGVASGFFFKPHQSEYALPSSSVWHISRYREDELPNMASNMAAAMYPNMHAGTHGSIPNRRFSVAAIPSSSSSSTSSKIGGQQDVNQHRRISVSKYQNIPESNYLAVPTFHDYKRSQIIEGPVMEKYVHEPAVKSKNKYRRKSMLETTTSRAIQEDRSSRKLSRTKDISESRISIDSRSKSPISGRSVSEERPRTPDPTASAPAFEFNSSHLPLRPPSINVNKWVYLPNIWNLFPLKSLFTFQWNRCWMI